MHAVAQRGGAAVTIGGAGVVLEHAHVAGHDRVSSKSLSFHAGRVSAPEPRALHLDLSGHLIFPALVNAHDHLQLNNIPPLAHANPFANSYEWIDDFEAHRGDPKIEAAVAVPSAVRHWHGALKNVFSGVTTVAHHDPWVPAFDEHDFPLNVLREYGWSHSLRLGESRAGQPPRYGPAVRASYLDTPRAYPWFIHLAEGTDAAAAAELGELDALGCLAENTVLIHGVGLSDADIDRVIACGAAVVWCPSSNIGMFGHTIDARRVRRLFDAECLAIGSDSRLTGARDLLDELRIAGAHSDLSPRELLRLATVSGAAVLRTPAAGTLDEGQHADCIVVRGAADPYDALLAVSRSDIRAVVRGGEPVIADLDFAEWFSACGITTVRARLDGKPKLIAAGALAIGAAALEAGMEIDP
jgi:cytosine/adenosine deaminase-related metal-dependent hydrolase